MSKSQIETILHKQQESRNAIFADGSNIHMELGKYGTDDLRNACNQASQTCRHQQSKQAVIADISSMPATAQDVIRMAVGEEKRKRRMEKETKEEEKRKRKWQEGHDEQNRKRSRVEHEGGGLGSFFMESVEESVIQERISKFIFKTNNDALRTTICGVCARERFTQDTQSIPLPDIPNSHLLKPFAPHPAHDLTHDLLLHKPRTKMGTPLPISCRAEEVQVVICKECMRDLRKSHTPGSALANNMWIGDIPYELRILTLPESVLVAWYFPATHIVKLFPKVKGAKYWDSDLMNSAVKGNVSTYWLDPNSIANMLDGKTFPHSPDILAATIGVTIIGPQNFPERTLPGFLRVRRVRVKEALIWLKANNPIYADIKISEDTLAQLPEDGISQQILETTRFSSDTSALERERSGYVVDDDEGLNGHDDREFCSGVPIELEGEF